MKKVRGESHTYDHTLFIGGKLFVRFAPEIITTGLCELIEPEHLPNKILEHYSMIAPAHKVVGYQTEFEVKAVNVLPFQMVLVPGWSYCHIESGDKYELLAIANIDREPENADRYPLTIMYRGKDGRIWSRDLSAFCRAFTHDATAELTVPTRIELIDSSTVEVSPISGSLYFSWGAKNIGFGETNIVQQDEGYFIQNEAMGKRFLKAALCALVDNAELEIP